MKINYFNFSQAQALCEDYQSLVGQPFEAGEPSDIVGQVVVAPYSRILQWQFVRSLLKGVSHQDVVSPDGKYDVLVLPEHKGGSTINIRVKSLRIFLVEHGFQYKPELYSCLR